jgi:hypothetical protein
MTHRARRHLTAWLGLIAMCLVAFAPTVSHFARAARTIVVPVCTVDGAQGEYRVNMFGSPMPAMSAMRAAAMTVMAMNGMGDMGDTHAMHHGSGADHDMGGHSADGSQPMDDCGYCDLLNHAPAMVTIPPAPLAPVLLLFAGFVLPALTRFTPFGAFPSGRPRGPPAVS